MNAIPWYKSQVIISAVITIVSTLCVLVPKIATWLDLTSPDAINVKVNAVFNVIAIASGIWTTVARSKSTVQPVTLTQASADAHLSTVNQAQPLSKPTSAPK